MKKENGILVTGSSGLLGAPIVKSLLKDGYNVIGLDPIDLNEQHKTINSVHNVMNICSKNKEYIDYHIGKTMFEKLIGYEISDDKFNDIISSQKQERL